MGIYYILKGCSNPRYNMANRHRTNSDVDTMRANKAGQVTEAGGEGR